MVATSKLVHVVKRAYPVGTRRLQRSEWSQRVRQGPPHAAVGPEHTEQVRLELAVVVLEMRADVERVVEVTYLSHETQTSVGGRRTEVRDPRVGQTFEVRCGDAGLSVLYADGSRPPRAEVCGVKADFAHLGKPDPLRSLLPKQVRVGEPIFGPNPAPCAPLGRAVMLLDAMLRLRHVESAGDYEVGVFDSMLTMQCAAGHASYQLMGSAKVRLDTGWIIDLEHEGLVWLHGGAGARRGVHWEGEMTSVHRTTICDAGRSRRC